MTRFEEFSKYFTMMAIPTDASRGDQTAGAKALAHANCEEVEDAVNGSGSATIQMATDYYGFVYDNVAKPAWWPLEEDEYRPDRN